MFGLLRVASGAAAFGMGSALGKEIYDKARTKVRAHFGDESEDEMAELKSRIATLEAELAKLKESAE